MKKALFFILFLQTANAFAQKSDDTRIFVTLTDTTGIYEKIRLAFVKADFMVKDDRNKDTLTTYPLNIKSTTYVLAYAAIKGNVIEFWGYMGDSHGNLLGATVAPSKNNYKEIFYFKHDKYWNKLLSVANMLNGTITYDKWK